jgi:hypothetical protein
MSIRVIHIVILSPAWAGRRISRSFVVQPFAGLLRMTCERAGFQIDTSYQTPPVYLFI